MLQSRPEPGSAADWLRYARADLVLARGPLPEGGLYALLCFHTQQVAEKSLKAVLMSRGVDPPRTHSIDGLIELIPDSIEIPQEVQEVVELSAYAVIARYPGDYEELDEASWQHALHLAEAVFDWTRSLIE
jgi:HEPN domain-containing protein